MKNKTSVIIVNYNSSKNSIKLIKSLGTIRPIIGEIIVVDNDSNQQNLIEIKKIKTIKLIENKKNYGFAKAVNIGIKNSKYPFILLINPDCEIIDKTPILTFKKICANKNIGMAGGKIINDHQQTQFTATSKPDFFTGLFEFTNLKKIFPNNIFTKKFWVESERPTTSQEVFSLCGAYIFLRKKGRRQMNYLDERFFLYLEDLDLGFTIEKNKQIALFDPQSQIKHIGGGSNTSIYNTVLKYWYDSRKKFFIKHLPKYQGYTLYIIFIIEELLLTTFHFFKNVPNE